MTPHTFQDSARARLLNLLRRRARAARRWLFRRVLTATALSTNPATSSRSSGAAAHGRLIAPKCAASIFTRIRDSHTPLQMMPLPWKNLAPRRLHPPQAHSLLCFCVLELG